MIGPLPAMGRRAAEKGYDWREMHNRWQSGAMSTLLVTAHLATPYIPAPQGNDIHLDSLLGAALLQDLPAPVFFPAHSAAVIPIPLALLWQSEGGLPLWAATPLWPVGEAFIGREYWHKRYPSDRADLSLKRAALTSAGRWKEYRTPVNAVTGNAVAGICVGVQSEVERLLTLITHVGKKGSIGYGRVGRWGVSAIPLEEGRQSCLIGRPLPVSCPLASGLQGRFEPRLGWTPPYWYVPWHEPCLIPEAPPVG